MGKRLIQQRRGRGTSTYRAPSHRYKGRVTLLDEQGVVTDLIHCAGHSAPLARVNCSSKKDLLVFAPENVKVGDNIGEPGIVPGGIMKLEDIPEGTLIHNIECRPGDGGKLVRASGAFARVVAKTETTVRIKLPSKKEKILLPSCRAAIGIIAGSGRVDKPFLRAGTKFKKMRAKNKLYPKVCGISMNAVDHPFGGKCSHIKGRPTQSPRSAPPGRKAGKIAPRRTGRRR